MIAVGSAMVQPYSVSEYVCKFSAVAIDLAYLSIPLVFNCTVQK